MSPSEEPQGTNNNENPPLEKVEIDALWFLYDLPRIPCLKHSVSWGVATGSLLSLHRYYSSRSVLKAVQMGMFGFILVAPISWTYCRDRYTSRRSALKATMDLQKLREANAKEREADN